MSNELRAVLLGVAVLAAVPTSSWAQAPAESDSWDARVIDVKGEVQVYAPGEDKPLPAEKGAPLNAGDRISTGEDASIDLSLDGGTVIHLSSLSDFTLSDTRRTQTAFKLTFGTFLAKVQKLLASQSLVVQAPTAVAAVRGTEFGVEVDPQSPDESHVGVFDEGKVEVKGETGNPELLIGGQETKVAKGQSPLHAYQLQRFMKHRSFMRAAMKKRLQTLKKTWKAVSPAERHELRRKAFAGMRERREKAERKGREIKEQRERQHQRERRSNEETQRKKQKMEEFREKVREHRTAK